MPRQARIDAPGALHHIICRGIEQRKIFRDDTDRDDFVRRLGDVLQRTSTPCLAWALIPNHFHLLLQTGRSPISVVMSKILTGYAVTFNHRHHRSGHLFQNRYKSILCQAELYLLELVRYIHLNPLRAGIVNTYDELERYPYCGHSRAIAGKAEPWYAVQQVLGFFGSAPEEARCRYSTFVAEGIAAGHRAEFSGGGLVRSVGGWNALIAAHRAGDFLKSDERILGDSDFVDSVLNAAGEQADKESLEPAQHVGLEQVAQRVAEILELKVEEVTRLGNNPATVLARGLLCYWGVKHAGLTATELGRKLGLSQSGVSRAAQRGEHMAQERGWQWG